MSALKFQRAIAGTLCVLEGRTSTVLSSIAAAIMTCARSVRMRSWRAIVQSHASRLGDCAEMSTLSLGSPRFTLQRTIARAFPGDTSSSVPSSAWMPKSGRSAPTSTSAMQRSRRVPL